MAARPWLIDGVIHPPFRPVGEKISRTSKSRSWLRLFCCKTLPAWAGRQATQISVCQITFFLGRLSRKQESGCASRYPVWPPEEAIRLSCTTKQGPCRVAVADGLWNAELSVIYSQQTKPPRAGFRKPEPLASLRLLGRSLSNHVPMWKPVAQKPNEDCDRSLQARYQDPQLRLSHQDNGLGRPNSGHGTRPCI